MRFSTIIVPFLASTAIAQPKRRQHQHAAKHHEVRDAKPVIVWVTEMEYTTEVIPVTTTIWVTAGFVPPAESTSTSSRQYKNTVPAQFYEPVKKPSSTKTSSSTTTIISVPTTTSAQPTTNESPPPPLVQSTQEKPVEQQSQPPVEPTPSPAPVTSSEAPSPKAPESTSTPPPQTQAPASVAPVASEQAPPTSSTGSGSSNGPCSSGNACSGDMTHYEAGLGACGWQSDGSTENVVALSHLMMGTQSNGNPFCGKSVTVKLNGKSIVAKVVDKCMGCEIHAIDLSDVAFAALEDMGVGRTQVEWYFN